MAFFFATTAQHEAHFLAHVKKGELKEAEHSLKKHKHLSVNCVDHDSGSTALIYAAVSDNGDMVKMLLQHDALLDIKNKVRE